jgi:hypothetical protein
MPKTPNLEEMKSALPLERVKPEGNPMLKLLCALVGHHRSRRRARPASGTWKSHCHLCGTRMQRISPGHWLPVSELPSIGAGARTS